MLGSVPIFMMEAQPNCESMSTLALNKVMVLNSSTQQTTDKLKNFKQKSKYSEANEKGDILNHYN